jgi:predicted nucleotidyltransferase
MDKKSNHSLDRVVSDTLNFFIDKFIKDPNVHGVLLAGSHAYGDPSKNSDLDIFIVYKELDWRERGNTWINGYEIEYFINPEKQIYEYMKTEDTFRPNTAHMFANGLVLYSKPKTDTLYNLVLHAKEVLGKPINEMTENDKELAKYWLDDLYKDLKDMSDEENRLPYDIISGEYIQYSLNLFFKIHRRIKEKAKRLPNQLKIIDLNFYEIIQKVLISNYEIGEIKLLKEYLESLIGGKRAEEWKLKTEVTFKNNI